MKNRSAQKGFTLIELLVVIGILAILLSIVLIAINPARQFGQANDTKRTSAVTQVLNAIGAYQASNKGNLPDEITALVLNTPTELSAANFPLLCAQLVPDYIPALPTDPSLNADDVDAAACAVNPPVWDTNYTITRGANNRITITAPDTEVAATDIEITR
jgi:prepilin-type N-terminal cleavage/methylation domain-containing protein